MIAGFLIIMAAGGVISRAAASMLVAQVGVEKVGRGKLSYSYDGNGTVVTVQQDQLFLWPEQQVEWVADNMRLDPAVVEMIYRISVTHPQADAHQILDKLEVNHLLECR